MISIRVTNQKQNHQFEHSSGSIEFGRGMAKGKCERFVLNDLFASRDQLRVEELPDGRLRAENLSGKQEVTLGDGTSIPVGGCREVAMPIRMVVGQTYLDFQPVAADVFDQRLLSTVDLPAGASSQETAILQPLKDLGESPTPETFAHWVETVIRLQRMTAGALDAHNQSARALVELIGLDQGMVLLRRDWNWEIVGRFPPDLKENQPFSKTLLSHVVAEKRTFYQDLKKWGMNPDSLHGVEAVVVSPIFGDKEEVVGALYGVRTKNILTKGGIRALEAQVVQLLAAATGANLARSAVSKTRAQSEQFFSAEVGQAVAREPGLLEGRDQEVTLLATGLHGWAELAAKLQAEHACRLLRDMMDVFSERIVDQGGVIVESQADRLLAMWNAPMTQPDHALLASAAALGILEELPELNKRWQELAGGPLSLGIGLHLAEVQVGSMGSHHRFKYAPFGPSLEVVQGVQQATRKLARTVLITGPIQEQLPDTMATRRLCQARLTGLAEPVPLYELHSVTGTPEWLAYRDNYENALMQYEFGQWARATQTLLPLMEQAQREDHYDPATLQLMRLACACLEKAPVPFDPVVNLVE